MSKKKDVERMKNALEAYLKAQEEELTPEGKRAKAWFPVHAMTMIKGTPEELENAGKKVAEDFRKMGFVKEEFIAFLKGMGVFLKGFDDEFHNAEKK